MTNAVSGLEMSMHHSGISSALTAAQRWMERTVNSMTEFLLAVIILILLRIMAMMG